MTIGQLKKLIATIPDSATVVVCHNSDYCVSGYVVMKKDAGIILNVNPDSRDDPWECSKHATAKDLAESS